MKSYSGWMPQGSVVAGFMFMEVCWPRWYGYRPVMKLERVGEHHLKVWWLTSLTPPSAASASMRGDLICGLFQPMSFQPRSSLPRRQRCR